MRIGLMVDCNCDLPRDFIDQHKIMVLPVKIRIGTAFYEDDRSPEATMNFHRDSIGDKTHDAETIPLSTQQINDLFLNRLVLEYDYVFCETVTRTRSAIFDNATQASYTILKNYHEVRSKNNQTGHFSLRVVDSKTVFAGQAALAAETARLISAGVSPTEIRHEVEKLADCTYGYGVPNDLFYLHSRARKKGDKSVGWLGAALGSAMDIKPIVRGHQGNTETVKKVRGYENAILYLFTQVTRLIEGNKLMSPYICISYTGHPGHIREFPGYRELKLAADKKRIELLLAVTSMSAGINLGPGALTLGYLAEPHSLDSL